MTDRQSPHSHVTLEIQHTMSRFIARNFLIQMGGKGLSILFGLISIAILTRALSPETFGEYTTIMTLLQLFAVIVDFGLTLSLVVMIAKPDADESQIVGNFFSLRVLSGLVVFGLTPIVAIALEYPNVMIEAVAWGAVGYLFMGAATMMIGVFQKHETIWRASLAELMNRLVLVGLLFLFWRMNFGLLAMVAAGVVANAVWLTLMILFAKRFVRVRPRIDLSVWKEAFTPSWPIAISIFFNVLYLKGDILFLAHFRTILGRGLWRCLSCN